MQTFLPLESFEETARVLDGRRLNNQVNECMVILRTCLGLSDGWANHPAVKMWRGYESALAHYTVYIVEECYKRWQNDKVYGKRLCNLDDIMDGYTHTWILGIGCKMPPWLGNKNFHRSHRQALLAKNTEWYRQFWPEEEAKIEYVWPVEETDNAHTD